MFEELENFMYKLLKIKMFALDPLNNYKLHTEVTMTWGGHQIKSY